LINLFLHCYSPLSISIVVMKRFSRIHISSYNRAAFTLVELLVVIVVIGILAGLVLSTVSRVRQTARRATCTSNMRQIGISLLNFASENKGALPPGLRWDRHVAAYMGITDTASATRPLPDINTTPSKMFWCPADDARAFPAARPRSYVANRIHTADSSNGVFNSSQTVLSMRLEQIMVPTRTILIVEIFTANYAGCVQWAESGAVVDGWYAGDAKGPKTASGNYYHGSGQNYLFADGHVSCLPVQKIRIPNNQWKPGS
jgi:prepilin-type N-terminal cleavage/methylation domain-containing protein/prepilin-type processing-associated H-X9-DG protein